MDHRHEDLEVALQDAKPRAGKREERALQHALGGTRHAPQRPHQRRPLEDEGDAEHGEGHPGVSLVAARADPRDQVRRFEAADDVAHGGEVQREPPRELAHAEPRMLRDLGEGPRLGAAEPRAVGEHLVVGAHGAEKHAEMPEDAEHGIVPRGELRAAGSDLERAGHDR